MSAGSRSGVNWMREKLRFVTWASERAVSVLATPGRSSSSTWPSATRPSSTSSSTSRLPTTARSSSSRMPAIVAAASVGLSTAGSSSRRAPAARGPGPDRRLDRGQQLVDGRRAGLPEEERGHLGAEDVRDRRRVLRHGRDRGRGGRGAPAPRRGRCRAAACCRGSRRSPAGMAMSRRSRCRSVSPWGRHGRTGHRTAGANGAVASVGYDRCQRSTRSATTAAPTASRATRATALGAVGPDDRGADGDEHGHARGLGGSGAPGHRLQVGAGLVERPDRRRPVVLGDGVVREAGLCEQRRQARASGSGRTPSVDRARVTCSNGRLGVAAGRRRRRRGRRAGGGRRR